MSTAQTTSTILLHKDTKARWQYKKIYAGVEMMITKCTLDDKTGPEAPLYVERA